MRHSVLVAAVLVGACSFGNAKAQEPPAVATVRSDPGFRKAAEGVFRQYEAGLSAHCTTITVDWSHATHIVYGAIQTSAAGLINTATWEETVPGNACGQPRRFRVLSVVRDGKGSLQPLIPGESNASPLLVKDARMSIAGAIGIHAPGLKSNCSMDVLDTEIVGHAIPKDGETWQEVWLISECDRRMRVPITFIPDGKGGTDFHLDPKKVVDVR